MQGKDQIPKFFTDYGEIRCKTAKGRKHFVFVNPNLAENNEMTTSMKTFIGLANYLPSCRKILLWRPRQKTTVQMWNICQSRTRAEKPLPSHHWSRTRAEKTLPSCRPRQRKMKMRSSARYSLSLEKIPPSG